MSKVIITADDLSKSKIILAQMIALTEQNNDTRNDVLAAKTDFYNSVQATLNAITTSENNAKASETASKASETAAKTSETNASTYASNASASADAAKGYMESAFSGTPEGYEELVNTRLYVDSEGYICLKE